MRAPAVDSARAARRPRSRPLVGACLVACACLAAPVAAQQSGPPQSSNGGGSGAPAATPAGSRVGTPGTRGVPQMPVFTPDTARAAGLAPNAALLDLVLPSLEPRTLAVIRTGDDALIPLSALAAAAELPVVERTPLRWAGRLGYRTPTLTVDLARGTARYGDSTRILAPTDAASHDGDVYLSARVFGTLTQHPVEVDWSTLELRVRHAEAFPAIERLGREAAREALADRAIAATLPPGLDLGSKRHLLRGFVGDYSLTAPIIAAKGASHAIHIAAGTELLGGALDVTTDLRVRLGNAPGTGTLPRTEERTVASWVTGWQRGPVRQLRVGEIAMTGAMPRLMRGAALSNAPYRRDSHFGMQRHQGTLGPGWSLEVYQGGVLVSIDSTDAAGRYTIEVPVLYGDNPVDVVGYGPGGERRAFSLTTRLPSSLLPRGRIEYGVSGGACVTYHCTASANADLRAAVLPRTVLRAGADYFLRDTLRTGGRPTLVSPYAGFTTAIMGGMTLDAVAMPAGTSRADLHLEPSRLLRLQSTYALYSQRDTVSPYATPIDRKRELSASGFLRPIHGSDVLYLEATAGRSEGQRTTTDRLNLSVSGRVAGIRLQPYLRRQQATPVGTARANAVTRQLYDGVRSTITPPLALRRSLGLNFLSLQAEEQRGSGVSVLSATLQHTIKAIFFLSATAEYRPAGGTTVSVMATLERPQVRSTTTYVATRGNTDLSEMAQGSLVWNGVAKRFAMSAEGSVEQGTVAGRVFVDTNNDGRWQPGEPPVDGVALIAEGRAAESGKDGRYRLPNLVPFEPMTITLDTTYLADPSVVPRYWTASLTPSPNAVRAVDFPFLPSGTIEGTVVFHDGVLTVRQAGVPLVLTSKAGRVWRTTTFSDGTFYVMGLAPGDYTVTVNPAILTARRWGAPPVTVSVPFAHGGARASGVEVRLTPATQPQASR